MIVFIGLLNFAFGDLIKIFSFDYAVNNKILYLNAFIMGSAFFYIVFNAWYVIALMPIKASSQTFADRIEEIKKHMQLLAYGYVWQGSGYLANFLIMLAMPICVLANLRYKFANEHILIALILALMPFVSKIKNTQKLERDNIGDISTA